MLLAIFYVSDGKICDYGKFREFPITLTSVKHFATRRVSVCVCMFVISIPSFSHGTRAGLRVSFPSSECDVVRSVILSSCEIYCSRNHINWVAFVYCAE